MSSNSEADRARKSERNRRAYEKSKRERDHVLLRFDPGGAAALDAAARSLGLSRSSFARLFLPALLAAASPRLAAVECARAATGESLGLFLGRALDEAIERRGSAAPCVPAAASEFDALFG